MLQDSQTTQRRNKAIKYLRLFLRDTEELNRLLRKEESDDEMLQFALDMAIAQFNVTAPIIGNYHIGNFPSLWILMHGAAVQILKSQGILQTRNRLTYQAGSSNILRSDKGPEYLQWAINFGNELALMTRNMKIAMNISKAYGGGAYSEYNLLGFAW